MYRHFLLKRLLLSDEEGTGADEVEAGRKTRDVISAGSAHHERAADGVYVESAVNVGFGRVNGIVAFFRAEVKPGCAPMLCRKLN